jgi:hypothetical protein
MPSQNSENYSSVILPETAQRLSSQKSAALEDMKTWIVTVIFCFCIRKTVDEVTQTATVVERGPLRVSVEV